MDDRLRYLQQAKAHADEGAIGEPAARDILELAEAATIKSASSRAKRYISIFRKWRLESHFQSRKPSGCFHDAGVSLNMNHQR